MKISKEPGDLLQPHFRSRYIYIDVHADFINNVHVMSPNFMLQHIPLILAFQEGQHSQVIESYLRDLGFQCKTVGNIGLLERVIPKLVKGIVIVDVDAMKSGMASLSELVRHNRYRIFTAFCGSNFNPPPSIIGLLSRHTIYIQKPLTIDRLIKTIATGFGRFGFNPDNVVQACKKTALRDETPTPESPRKDDVYAYSDDTSKEALAEDDKFIKRITSRIEDSPEKPPLVIEKIMKKITSGDITFPILPKIAIKIQEQLNDPEISANELAQTLSTEPAVSARIIAVVNSPLYGGVDAVTNLPAAIARLGLDEVTGITLSVLAVNAIKVHHKRLTDIMKKLWIHSLACAVGTRIAAQQLRKRNLADFFLYGIIHDIGKQFLLSIFENLYEDEAHRFEKEDTSFDEAKVLHWLNYLHTDFGGALMRRWGLVKDSELVSLHHHMPHASFPMRDEINILDFANTLTRAIGYSISAEENTDASKTLIGSQLGYTEESILPAQEDIKLKADTIKQYFGV